MKRLLRIASHTLAFLSTLLFFLTVILWLRSLILCDEMKIFTLSGDPGSEAQTTRSVTSAYQALMFHKRTQMYPMGVNFSDAKAARMRRIGHWEWASRGVNPTDRAPPPLPPGRTGTLWNQLGFRLYIPPFSDLYGEYFADIPHWFVALITAAWPAALLLLRHKRRRRLAANLCPTCGYDLRATPDRCPECGTLTSSSAPAAPTSSARDTG